MKRGSTEWTPIYLVIVAAIALVLIVTFIKPMLQQGAGAAEANTQAAIDVAKAGLFLVTVN